MKTGKITFEIRYADGILPEVFPAARAKMTRAEKATMKAKTQNEPDTATETISAPETGGTAEESASAVIEELPARELPAVIIEPVAFFKPEETPISTIEETEVLASPIEEVSAENTVASEDTNERNDEQNHESGTMEIFYKYNRAAQKGTCSSNQRIYRRKIHISESSDICLRNRRIHRRQKRNPYRQEKQGTG